MIVPRRPPPPGFLGTAGVGVFDLPFSNSLSSLACASSPDKTFEPNGASGASLDAFPPSNLTNCIIFCLATFKSLAIPGSAIKFLAITLNINVVLSEPPPPETLDAIDFAPLPKILEPIELFKPSGIFILGCR